MNELPQAIANYVEATNAQAPQRVAACFHNDGIVRDDGHVHRGRADIGAWADDAAKRYRATIEPAGLEQAAGRQILRAVVRGDFSGSPLTLHFKFALRADGIDSLEITP